MVSPKFLFGIKTSERLRAMAIDNPTATTSVPESTAVLTADSAPTLPAAAPGRVQILFCLSAFLAALNFFAPTPSIRRWRTTCRRPCRSWDRSSR